MAAAIIAARNAYISAKDHRMRNMTTHHETDLPWLREFIAESQSLGFTDEAKPQPTAARHRCFAAGEDARLPAWYRRAAAGARRVVQHRAFEVFVTACIALVGVNAGIDATHTHSAAPPRWAARFGAAVSWSTLTVFTLECALKIVACGADPWAYFLDAEDGSYNAFDFAIVVASWAFIESGSGEAIKVMRLLRLVRVMNMIPQLRVILKGLFAGLSNVGNILLLLVLVMFMFGVLGVTFFGQNDPMHFGNLKLAMLTLFRCATLADVVQIFEINYFGCDIHHGGIYTDAEQPLEFATAAGRFPDFACYAPKAQPITIKLFVFLYEILAGLMIISLFISVITMGMLSALDEMQRKHVTDGPSLSDLLHMDSHRSFDPERNPRLRARLAHAFHDDPTAATDEAPRCCAWYATLAQRSARVARSAVFNGVVVACIVAVSVSVGVQTDLDDDEASDAPPWSPAAHALTRMDFAVLWVFTIECVVKVVAQGERPLDYLRSAWDCFDLVVVALSWLALFLNLGNVACLRLVRLLRVFKLANNFPALRKVVNALLRSCSGVGYIMILWVTTNFIFAVLGIIFFGKNDPAHFGSLPKAMMTVWFAEMFDNWEQFMYINMYGCDRYGYVDVYGNAAASADVYHCSDPAPAGWWAAVYFVFVVIYGGLVMQTVLIGVVSIAFTDSVANVSESVKTEAMMAKVLARCARWYPDSLAERVDALRAVFAELDQDESGAIDVRELGPFIKFFMEHYLDQKDVPYEHVEEMFYALDVDNSADVNLAEFLWFMLACNHYLGHFEADEGAAAASAAEGEVKQAGTDDDDLERVARDLADLAKRVSDDDAAADGESLRDLVARQKAVRAEAQAKMDELHSITAEVERRVARTGKEPAAPKAADPSDVMVFWCLDSEEAGPGGELNVLTF